MIDEIRKYLRGVSLKNSNHKVVQMVADHFGGIATSNRRYVKIDDVEYSIRKNPDNSDCGWDIAEMDWSKNGNNWKFFNPY